MSAFYSRYTELRKVHAKDLYNLAVILDDDNYWQTLMEVIPKHINNETFGTVEDLENIASGSAYDRKYSNDHIRLIENVSRRPGESRLGSQILFDEWSTSGRKHERPTLGVLLQLLVQLKLYRAADFVAELLKESKPPRPNNGPAADFEFEVDVFNDIQETVNDTRFYPTTEELQENVNIDINKDYYTKYQKNVDKNLTELNDHKEEPIRTTPPKPPPRLLKSARLIKQQQQMLQQSQLNQLLQQTTDSTKVNNENVEKHSNPEPELMTESNSESTSALSLGFMYNIPKLSALMITTANNEATTTITTKSANNSITSENLLPKFSAFDNSSIPFHAYGENGEDDSLNSIPSLIFTKSNIAEDYEQQLSDLNSIPIVVLGNPLNTDCGKKEKLNPVSDVEVHADLPLISVLNLNSETGADEQHQQQHQQNSDFVPSVALLMNMNYNQNSSGHQLGVIEEDYNGIEYDHNNDLEVEPEDDEDSIPNLSFLENRSSNNESSLTSVTNTSGENSFEQSANDFSSTSADNIPILSILNP